MDQTETQKQPSGSHTATAFAVHVFTACGAGCALLALMAAVESRWTRMFVWLGIVVC